MSDVKLKVVIAATAEVRDKDGNLISQTPVELTGYLSEAQVDELRKQQESAS